MPETLPVLQGRFLLQKKLGEGGMAEVWSAYDNRLGVWRAVKLLLADFARRTKLRKRFESEARAMAVLEHPNIVRVYDVGSEGPRSWIVMELCDAGSLESWLEKNGPMPPRLAVDVTLEIAAGIAHAHAHGVIHRDIKPQNVLISRKGTCKVTDFGIAHFEDESLTRTGTVMGTLGFMAPEQRSDAKKVDRRSDVYSVAATLFTLLTGRTEMDLFAAGQDPTILDGVPAMLCPVIQRAVSYHRDDRYQTINELVGALQKARLTLPADPRGTPPLAVDLGEPPARPSMVEQALAEAAESADESAAPPLPGETILPSYDLFEGASIPPSLRRAAEQQAPNRRSSSPPTLATPAPSGPRPREVEPALQSTAPPAKSRGGNIPWVPPAERRRKDEDEDEDFDFESLYVQGDAPTKAPDAPSEIGSGLFDESARVVDDTPHAEPLAEEEEDPGSRAGRVWSPSWALKEAWKFITQLITGMLGFASRPVQYLVWPVVAALVIGAVASFHGASAVLKAQTTSTSDFHVFTATLDRTAPDVIEEIADEGGSRQVLDAQWTRYQAAKSPEAKQQAALEMSRLLEEQVTRLDKPNTPDEIGSRKVLTTRIRGITQQRATFIQAQRTWRAVAATNTGRLAVSLGLAHHPPPPQ